MSTFSPAYGYYDVTAYGATGNGTIDDAPSIQTAITACQATGGVLFFPPGTYLIKSTLPITASNVTLMGSTAGSCTIKLDASAGTTTPMVTVSATKDNVIITELTFQSNGTNNGPGAAPGSDVITFGSNGGGINHYCKVLRCKFISTSPGNCTPGSVLHFWNTSDGEVSECHFFQVGYDNGNSSDANVTPAVYAETSCVNVRVHHNHFEQCNFDGVRIKGTACDVSYNYFLSCKNNAIDVGVVSGTGSGIRMLGNFIQSTGLVQTTNQGINLALVQDFHVIGNTVTQTAGHGIATYGCSSGVLVGNIAYDNSKTSGAGSSGIYFEGRSGTNKNKGVAFVGNVAFDDGTATQQFGLNLKANGGTATDLALVGNTFWGNTSADIEIDSTIIADNSNAAISNTGWLDRVHRTSHTTTGSGIQSLPGAGQDPVIAACSMRTNNGLRIVASGKTVTGAPTAGSRTFYLGLNTSGNLMPALNAGTADADWQLIAYVCNDAAFNSQHSFVQFWYGGSLIFHAPASTSVLTNNPVTVLLQGALGHSLDSIVLHFLSVERV